MSKNTSQIELRWMIRRDLLSVHSIERESFRTCWSLGEFLRVLRQRNCIGMVAEIDDEVVGFMVYELIKSRIQILNFAVASVHRNNGVGSAMVHKLVGKLTPERRSKLTLQISDNNLHAHLFFSRHGFLAKKVVKDAFLDGSGEDAYLFEFDIAKQARSVACVAG
jgi:ribosomal-protein-alanine N-acetyltransferase